MNQKRNEDKKEHPCNLPIFTTSLVFKIQFTLDKTEQKRIFIFHEMLYAVKSGFLYCTTFMIILTYLLFFLRLCISWK